jgi:SAM-dependent methyltransferase
VPDVYATIAAADPEVVAQLADRLELRAADPLQRAILHAYLAEVPFGEGADVLEVGCGTGAVARVLARWPGVRRVRGVDPSPLLLDRARQLAHGIDNLTFETADGRDLAFADDELDVVVFHTCLCHVPEPERALREARRVLRHGGRLVVFDGDYSSTSVSLGANDPLQTCIDAAVAWLVHDPWLVRKLAGLVRATGFELHDFRGHAYIQTSTPSYMLSLIALGADLLAADGRVAHETRAALMAEARRRAEQGVFFGSITYASVVASKPEGHNL